MSESSQAITSAVPFGDYCIRQTLPSSSTIIVDVLDHLTVAGVSLSPGKPIAEQRGALDLQRRLVESVVHGALVQEAGAMGDELKTADGFPNAAAQSS